VGKWGEGIYRTGGLALVDWRCVGFFDKKENLMIDWVWMMERGWDKIGGRGPLPRDDMCSGVLHQTSCARCIIQGW